MIPYFLNIKYLNWHVFQEKLVSNIMVQSTVAQWLAAGSILTSAKNMCSVYFKVAGPHNLDRINTETEFPSVIDKRDKWLCNN